MPRIVDEDVVKIRTGVTSQAYRDNYDRVFGEEKVVEENPPALCPHCGRALDKHGLCPDL